MTNIEKCMWELIPEEKINAYLDKDFKGNTLCLNCNKILNDLKMIPYAYEKENNDIIFITKCPHCGDIMYFRE